VPPFNVLLFRSGESDREEIANVVSATGAVVELGAPLELTHVSGTKVHWRLRDLATTYFATEVAATAERGDTTLTIGRLAGAVPAPPFDAELSSDDGAATVVVTATAGAVWTLDDPLVGDARAGTRVAAPRGNFCVDASNTDAWDTNDATSPSPSVFDATWASGAASSIHIYGIGLAAETTDIYVDVPADGAGLYTETPAVHRVNVLT
jgi:hypothetical protein